MYNIQKYRVPKNSQCLKGSDYSLHDRSNRTSGKLHRRAQSLTSQGTELKNDQSYFFFCVNHKTMPGPVQA